ncbi:MAG: hypothetical protein A3J59_03905 [Candidatus Buchananbacteria bacterium RIFCSPHIGHO2_02_FULL_56_16]|uniref:DUF4345 domain-containing protein n=1 Tax=Candidatus Buchananbacteria bacterium RIFCSPHIGHO2_02_FULL_56_16 TaxID=1797542 RepID=A0A1G1YI71_9BACT|nr:MAG: hypothetical protein A3J59_03905 [Candidatus Buchananbacteria bacterium RIFCSPHIGHO2_02_FULL_56_16]
MSSPLNKQAIATAAAGTVGVAYAVCALFVSLWPRAAMALMGWLVHLVNVDRYAGDIRITFPGFIFGLVEAMVYAAAVSCLFAWLYERASR